MSQELFYEGVRPGGLSGSKDIRILLCYLLDSVSGPVTRQQLEDVLLGEELVNYFVMAESLALLKQQALVTETPDGFFITDAGRTVGRTLSQDVPHTVRETAVRGIIRAQQYAAKAAAHQSDVEKTDNGYHVKCNIRDDAGVLFGLELYMPKELAAEAVKQKFIEHGDAVYKLVLAALTDDAALAKATLREFSQATDR